MHCLSSLLSVCCHFQGARDLAKPPTLTEIVHATLEKAKTEESLSKEENKDEQQEEEEDNEVDTRGLKRKLDPKECTEDQGEDSHKAKGKGRPNEMEKVKKAKNVGTLFGNLLETLFCNDFEVV